MRLTEKDPEFIDAIVLLDGVPQICCCMADDEQGVVQVYEIDEVFSTIGDRPASFTVKAGEDGKPVTVERKGRVEIEIRRLAA